MSEIVSRIPALTSTDPRVSIGRFTYGQPRLLLWMPHDRIEIGPFCSISQGVTILGGGEHNTQWISTHPLRIAFGDPLAGKDDLVKTPRRPTVIGADVWIGFGATILSEVTIGHGAVIGAGAVVGSDVPPYGIVFGNPAKLHRLRFDAVQIEALLRLRWWDWPLERIRDAVPRLCSSDIEALLADAGGPDFD